MIGQVRQMVGVIEPRNDSAQGQQVRLHQLFDCLAEGV